MKTISVDLGDRKYPIHVGQSILQQTDLYQPHLCGNRVFIISNEKIAPLYSSIVTETLSPLASVEEYRLPDGEIHKTLTTVSAIFDHMLAIPCDRKTTLITLGGGVVGDIGGFAAAAYQRGIPYIHIPTTLLAQVDSSIGGKTGVNHQLGKNMIGAIYQPKCVIADTDTLNTLPEREMLAGLAEVIKYGLIRDPEFFTWLENNVEGLLAREMHCLTYAIERSCVNKAEVVALDERETGNRALLNFGHTFGHAIENKLGYQDWLHGEAVAAGMVMAAEFSWRLNMIDSEQKERVENVVRQFKLPVSPPSGMTVDDFISAMSVDKKVAAGKIRFVVLEKIGKAVLIDEYPRAVLQETLMACLQP